MELRLEQEPRPDYVRYSFAFWEASGLYSGAVQEVTRTEEAASGGSGGVLSHTVEQGDTLWAISGPIRGGDDGAAGPKSPDPPIQT